MKRSSIYNRIHNDARKSDCSFGASGGFAQEVLVGWGSSDSHTLGLLEVTEEYDYANECKVFTLSLDGHILKRATYFGKSSIKIESATFK